MSDTSVHATFERFRTIRGEVAAAEPEPGRQLIREGAVLAVGILLGGGFPGAAASVTLLLEGAFPGDGWPWLGGAEA